MRERDFFVSTLDKSKADYIIVNNPSVGEEKEFPLQLVSQNQKGEQVGYEYWTVETFDDSCVPDFAAVVYREILPYVQDFLCAPHPFREGVMCPFVPSALKHSRIFFTTCSTKDTFADHAKRLEQCAKWFLSRKQKDKGFGALIILFPKEYDTNRLLELHFQNKEQCVRHSLMLGALYRTNPAPSLHNKDYYPLRTPTPVLVIRDMVASDLVFLHPRRYNTQKRLLFLESFLRTFEGHKGSATQKEVETARRLHRHYRRRQRFVSAMKTTALVSAVALLIIFLLLL